MKMKTSIRYYLILAMLITVNQILAQKKVVITDRAQFINQSIEAVLYDRLIQDSVELTSMIDTRKRCDYLFLTLANESGELIMSALDCNDKVAGWKNLGARIFTATDPEKGMLLYFALADIVKNRGNFSTEEAPAGVRQETIVKKIPELEQPDPEQHKTRYFFAPSSYNLDKGELYYNTLYFFIHDVQYGISDRFSMGMGTTIIGMPFYLTPKLSLPIDEKSSFAIGDLMMIGTFGTNFFGNLLYGTYSRGGPYNNITLGLGWLHSSDNEITKTTNSPVFNMSFLLQASNHIYFVNENYISLVKTKRTADYYYYNQVTAEYTSYHEEFKQNMFFVYGLAGFRFINKTKDVNSWQFGLTYVFTSFEDMPYKYKASNWYTSAGNGSRFIAFPVVGFARKFSTRY
jgi:hypothetical protein